MKRRTPVEIEAARTGIPMPDYLSMDALGASDLEKVALSPAECFHHMHAEEPPPRDDSRDFGTAIHYALLQPELFKERVGFLPSTYDGRKKEYKGLLPQMRAKYRVVLKHHRQAQVDKILANAKACQPFWNLLTLPGEPEVTVTVRDPETNVMCKCRPDRLLPEQHILFDLKTTRARTKREFARQAFNLGYDRKMAFYLQQLRWLREKGLMHGEYRLPVIGAVQNDEPFNVGIFVFPEDFMEAAWASGRALLHRAAICVETGEWPGWDDEPTTLDPEKWMLNQRLADSE